MKTALRSVVLTAHLKLKQQQPNDAEQQQQQQPWRRR